MSRSPGDTLARRFSQSEPWRVQPWRGEGIERSCSSPWIGSSSVGRGDGGSPLRRRITFGDVLVAAGMGNWEEGGRISTDGGVISEISSNFRDRLERQMIGDNPSASSSSMAGSGSLKFGLSQPKHCSEFQPIQPFGASLEDLVNHSWSSNQAEWIWIPRGSTLSEKNLGFPATKGEIRRFGARARRIFKIRPRFVDSRSFAEVVGGKFHGEALGGSGSFW